MPRRQQTGSVRTMLDRIKERHDIDPERLIADTAYGSGPMLGWLVDRDINPHIPVLDKGGEPMGLGAGLTLNGTQRITNTSVQRANR